MRTSNLLWAQLMQHSFGFDVLSCPQCGGRLRLIAVIEEGRVIRRMLGHLGLPTEVPAARPSRAPPIPFDRVGATRILLTCRDYSVDQVRASFLQPTRIKYGVIQVPPLDDAELAQVEAAHPPLAVARAVRPRDKHINRLDNGRACRPRRWAAERPAAALHA